MDKLTISQRLMNIVTKPHHIMILNQNDRKPARNLKIYPFAITLIGIVLLLLAFFTGSQLTGKNQSQPHIAKQLQLEQRYNQLHNQLAEANATAELMKQESESLKQELLSQQEKNSELSNRLHMLESILEARKMAGTQLLNAELKWVGRDKIQYHFTLVKGGNYPRRVSGSILLTAQSPEGETIEIKLGKQESKLPFRIETHTFLRGFAGWEHDWLPDRVMVIVSDQRGKEIIQMEIAIKGAPQ